MMNRCLWKLAWSLDLLSCWMILVFVSDTKYQMWGAWLFSVGWRTSTLGLFQESHLVTDWGRFDVVWIFILGVAKRSCNAVKGLLQLKANDAEWNFTLAARDHSHYDVTLGLFISTAYLNNEWNSPDGQKQFKTQSTWTSRVYSARPAAHSLHSMYKWHYNLFWVRGCLIRSLKSVCQEKWALKTEAINCHPWKHNLTQDFEREDTALGRNFQNWKATQSCKHVRLRLRSS